MFRDRVLLLVLVAGLGMGCGKGGPLDTEPAPGPETVYGSVLGRVTVDGLPVAGVSVALTRGGARIASLATAASGEYEFVGLEPGVYSVGIIWQILGASCATLKAATVLGGKRTEVNFACQVPRGSVMGRVTRNGIGLAGVEVYLCDTRSWWGGCFLPVQFTNPQGFYAYDIGRGHGTYFLFADCGPVPWSGALVGPTSAQVQAVAGRHHTVNFECP